MKFVILITALVRGGTERFASNLSLELAKNHDVILGVFDEGLDYPYGGRLCDFKTPSQSSGFSRIVMLLRRSAKLKKLARKEKPDVVISLMNAPNRMNTLTKLPNTKQFVSCRGYRNLTYDYRTLLQAQKRIDGVVFNSKELREIFIKEFGGNAEKAFYLPNIIEIENIESLAMEPLNEPELEAFLDSHRVIASMGRQSKEKMYTSLIEAFEIAREKHPELGLVIIGGKGDDVEGIRNAARACRFSKDIYFTGDRSNPYNILKRCDIYALTSKGEGLPNALIEAMVCGNVPVSVDCRTGPEEILRKNFTGVKSEKAEVADYGILTPQIDKGPEKFAEGLEMVLSDEKLFESLKILAKKRAGDFSSRNAMKRFMELVSD